MKAVVICAGAIAGLAAAPTEASVFTVGGPLSWNCYKSADKLDARASALESCTRALAEENLMPADRAATLVNRGILNRLLNRTAAAESDFTHAAAANPKLSEAWLNQAYLLLKQNRSREALPLIDRGIELGAQRPAQAYLARGIANEQVGNYKAAYDDLVRARDLEPGWSEPGTYLTRYSVRGH